MNLADTESELRSNQDQADEAFRRSIDSLSRLLASRPVEPPPPLPEVELFPRGTFSFRRFATAGLLLIAAVAAVSAGIYSFLHNAVPPQGHKIETVVAAPPPPPAAAIRPVASISTIVPPPANPAPVSAAELTPPKAVVSQPLDARGISELQTKLSKTGFSPGPIDGVAGPITAAAIKRYQQARGLAQTGAADSEVLDQLRQETAR